MLFNNYDSKFVYISRSLFCNSDKKLSKYRSYTMIWTIKNSHFRLINCFVSIQTFLIWTGSMHNECINITTPNIRPIFFRLPKHEVRRDIGHLDEIWFWGGIGRGLRRRSRYDRGSGRFRSHSGGRRLPALLRRQGRWRTRCWPIRSRRSRPKGRWWIVTWQPSIKRHPVPLLDQVNRVTYVFCWTLHGNRMTAVAEHLHVCHYCK